MALLFQRIDSKIANGASTTIHTPGRTKSYNPAGRLFQNFLSSQPVHQYDYSHGVRSRADFQAVLNIFYVVMFTPYDGFLHKDWRDYQASQLNSNCAPLTATTLQLQRVHSFGGVAWNRNITKPNTSATGVQVFRTRTGATSGISSSVDTTTGIVTISGHVAGDTYTWSGEFDVPVTFTDDDWAADLEVNTINLWLTSNPIKVEELVGY